VLENNDFGVYVEQEPYIRELLDAYVSSKFKIVLELLDKFSVRDFIHSTHLPEVLTWIP
jgi:COP9 signalosome complex subunit 1